ncbi:MAG: hypothetical protein LBD59_02745 [Prevotellaceae bacterium]|nr:hypothetical protein [Prevotellaceae bacterium]
MHNSASSQPLPITKIKQITPDGTGCSVAISQPANMGGAISEETGRAPSLHYDAQLRLITTAANHKNQTNHPKITVQTMPPSGTNH